MLYILPPPAAPTPPSPWPSILCSSSNRNKLRKSASDGINDPWGAVTSKIGPSNKRPPRSHSLRIRSKRKESGAAVSVDEEDGNRNKSLSECYFAGKGAALVLPPNERARPSRRLSSSGCDIQQHLQSMFYLLRPEETLKMAVKLESVHPGRTRYLVVVSCIGRQDAEECCLLGIDCNEKTTVGLVLRVLADTTITLDGDGGFSVCVCGQQHIFKPVSVQAMWSALQTLHKVSSKAREQNYFQGGLTHDWVSYYEQRIESDRSCLNEWHAMDNIESRRPPSPDSVRSKPRQREETERVIRCTLKEIMMSVDLDEVTSKHIRSRLEEDLDMDLGEFKPFIDEEMLTILGQMDAATEIFDHVYLGSEWNASNHEELQKNGVRHILNVTREIDNFFPGMFNYLNIRVYDDEKTDLLKHWDDTYKYINRARAEGSKVLVHCKMGVSRSASVVIAYAMKAYNWDFKKAYEYVKQKRNCIKPNCSFMSQLETYQGILDAMKNKEKLQRSKSETNLKSPCLVPKDNSNIVSQQQEQRAEAKKGTLLTTDWTEKSGAELGRVGGRPKSWSPDNSVASMLFTGEDAPGPVSVSMEHLISDERPEQSVTSASTEMCPTCRTGTKQDELPCKECFKLANPQERNHNSHVRMPCGNGQMYSVSQNRIVYLPGTSTPSAEESEFVPSVKHRVIELESQNNSDGNVLNKKSQSDRKGLVLNLTSQFETSSTSKSGSPTETDNNKTTSTDVVDVKVTNPNLLNAILVKEEVWDPGEKNIESSDRNNWINSTDGDKQLPVIDNKVGRTRREGDPFSDKLDRVFDREERKQAKTVPTIASTLPPTVPETGNERESPSRQSSWSSYDSAVVLGYQGEPREAPSRQSSWGSGDLRGHQGALPSRNSSWGSYDMKPTAMHYVNETREKTEEGTTSSSGMFPYDKEDIPWYPGTVKRTKQKLEEVTTTQPPKEPSAVNDEVECSSTTSSSSPPPPKTEISVCNLKIHGPKPYQTPVLSKDLRTFSNAIVVEPVNPVLVHYASSPSLSTRPSEKTSSTEKMTLSQPNMTLLEEECWQKKKAEADETQLSASAPESYSMMCEPENKNQGPCVINTTQCSSVRHQKQVLENLTNKCCALPKRCLSMDESVMGNEVPPHPNSGPEPQPQQQQKSVPGIVKNLKKEFEAKSVSKSEKTLVNFDNGDSNSGKQSPEKVRSMPSSPVSTHHEPQPSNLSEDLSVKNLVGKYEIKKQQKHKEDSKSVNEFISKSHHHPHHPHPPPPPPGKKSLEITRVKNPSLLLHNLKNTTGEKVLVLDRPPTKTPSPSVVVASVVAKAASKKQQQGKTHPLAHLTINPRHNNAVYNTM